MSVFKAGSDDYNRSTQAVLFMKVSGVELHAEKSHCAKTHISVRRETMFASARSAIPVRDVLSCLRRLSFFFPRL